MTEAQRHILSQRLHFTINRAADEYGKPLSPGLAMFISQKIIQDMPSLLEALKNSAEGKVT
jgi:hypothetical protein